MFKLILALIFHWELADQVCAAFPRLTLFFYIRAMPYLLQQVAQGQGSQAEREQVFASACAPGCADKPAPSLTDKWAPSLTTAEKGTSEGSSEPAYFVELNKTALAPESH